MLTISYTYTMELHQIRHFVSVAETGSFTKGAQRAAVSQPALSASIAKLELELDAKLLDRRHQRVVLTKAGEMFLNTARSVLLAWLLSLSTTVIPVVGARRPASIADSARAADIRLDVDLVAAIADDRIALDPGSNLR